jgi:hypothetical protein
VKRTDELLSLGNHAGQVVEEFQRMVEDFVYVKLFFQQLRTSAKDFRPLPESREILRLNANTKPENPVEEMEMFERKLRNTLADLDRADALLKARRAEILDLLK